MTGKPSERGIALLTVLSLVAIIAVIAATTIERVRIATRLATNGAATGQARAYGLAAEAIAKSRVADLLSVSSTKTSLQGDWHGRPTPFPIDGGTAVATLTDGGNCFNLNSMVSGSPTTSLAANPVGMLQFERLLGHLGIPAKNAQPLAAAITDWIDSDTVPLPSGAEDGAYGSGSTSLRTANTLLADVSEIRVIRGMSAPLYRRIRPWVCALPVAELSPVNVNTLSAGQAPLIAMLAPAPFTLDMARRLIEARPEAGFESADAFWSPSGLQGLTPPAEARAQVRLKSQWFKLGLTVTIAGASLRSTTLIDARKPEVKTISRVYGDPV